MYTEIALSQGAAVWRSVGSHGGIVVPADGCVDLILRDGRVDVAGPSTRWLATARDGRDGSIGFRLPPGQANQLLSTDLSLIVDQLIPLEDVVVRVAAVRLREAMLRLEAGLGSSIVPSIAAELGGSSCWSYAVRRAAYDAVPAGDAGATFAGSDRSFRRRMRTTFGYGYATLVRLERARRAQRRLRSGSSIAAAAAEAGFADQSHLSREFARLVGQSPAQFASNSA